MLEGQPSRVRGISDYRVHLRRRPRCYGAAARHATLTVDFTPA